MSEHTLNVYRRWTDATGHLHLWFRCPAGDLSGTAVIDPTEKAEQLVTALTIAHQSTVEGA